MTASGSTDVITEQISPLIKKGETTNPQTRAELLQTAALNSLWSSESREVFLKRSRTDLSPCEQIISIKQEVA